MWTAVILYVAAIALLPWTTAADPFLVVGVQTGIDVNTHQRPARRNVNDLYTEKGPEWDLYILALSSLQAVNETDELSYFQISGIHGLPYSAWNGVEQVAGAPLAGYCPHGELLFSTWHRPYLALFEQVLVSHAVSISTQYSPSVLPQYQAAAQTLRLPYWDWASDPNIPDIAGEETVTVNGPGGPTTISNPLYSYRFQQGSVQAGFGGDLARYPETIRCLGVDGEANNITATNANMAGHNLGGRVYDVFVNTLTFDGMAFSGSKKSNFESPHNLVHTKVSCKGTLRDINWSAFDPLFMLHHCNIDRLVALWQAINPSSNMFNTTGVSLGQFATPKGTVITQDSPLKPFYDSSSSFYTSYSVTNISTFGYTYPEINELATTPEELASFVRTQVNNLYGMGESVSDQSKSVPVHQIHSNVPRTDRYYVAKIQVDRSELPLPVTVDLVLNDTTVGTMAILAMPSEGVASASIPLSDLGPGGLPTQSTNWKSVSLSLQNGLTVDIRRDDDTVIPVSNVPSLEIELHAIEYTLSIKVSEFPRLGDVAKFPVSVRQHHD